MGLSEDKIGQTKKSKRDAGLTDSWPTMSGALERLLSIVVSHVGPKESIHTSRSVTE